MDADIFVSGKKKLRIQKYPDTYGRGLSRKLKLSTKKLEIKLIDRKVAKEKLTDGQSNLLFSNDAHALYGAIDSWRNISLIA